MPCGIQRPIRLVAFSEFSEISTLTCHQVHNLKKHFVTLHLSLLVCTSQSATINLLLHMLVRALPTRNGHSFSPCANS